MSEDTGASERDDLKARLDSVPFWWHSIDLGGGVLTPGRKSAELLQQQLSAFQLPDLRGRSVLDIGAWDGFFSFHAEKQGASRVVALDHYVWSIDFSKALDRIDPAVARRENFRPAEQQPELWRPADLPGKRGFDLCHGALGSRVEPVVADFMAADLAALGQFDVVFYFGVLYHMRHPLLALERLAQVTRDVAVIETEAIWVPRLESQAFCEFFESNELLGDPSNWWAPNAKALSAMCRAAGFRRVEIVVTPHTGRGWLRGMVRTARSLAGSIQRYRLVAHAIK